MKRRLGKRHVSRVMRIILQEMAANIPVELEYSWGVINRSAAQIYVDFGDTKRLKAALMLEVAGLRYCGKLYITMNQVNGTFDVYCVRNGRVHRKKCAVPRNKLGEVLNKVIQTGRLNVREYLCEYVALLAKY